jgi:PAS domain S-box-containing protein
MRWTPADAPDEESPALQASALGEDAAFKPDLSTRILLADDNADMRQYVEHILDKQWAVEAVADGNAALEAARRRIPDLVLSDVMMPGLDGFDLLRELRSDLRTRDVPVILLSARAGEESRIEGLDAGADDYLVKPFSARELLARVGAYLKLTRLRREAQEQIRNILESITDGFVSLDRDCRYVYINAEAERMGLNREQLLGKRIWDVFPDILGTNIESALRRAADEQVAVEFEGRNQEWQRTFAFKAYPNGDDGLTIYFQDITERKLAEETLRASQAQLQTLFDEAPIGIYLVDADLRIRQVNPRALPVFGDIPELIGRDFDDVIHRLWTKEYADEIVRIFRHTLETGEPYFTAEKIEERLDRGVTEYYEWQTNRIPLPTGDYGVVCYFRDISAEVFARRERERLLQAERDAREVADQASRAKDEFLATVSHELRNPLNAMLGWARVLSGNGFNNEIRARGLKAIEQNARAQAQLIEDLLDVSRIISGKFRLNVEPIQVVGVIEAAIESVRPAADAKGVRLQATLDPNAGPVSGDAGRLQQVVWNLLANAVKFTQKDGRVQVRLARVNSHIEVVVSDTGQGIIPDFLPYVFDRFRQADGSSTRMHGGLGLGLAIVRHIVELHGGSVSAESPGKNQGSSFTVRLPLMVIHTKPDDQARGHQKLSGEGTLQFTPSLLLEGVKVLIVDDEPETLLLLSTVLTQSGAYVKTAASAAEGFREVQAWRPQVIVSDIGMPEENGYAFMKRVKGWARETGAWIPAVALTAYARAEDRIKALESGYQIHVPKPVEPTELVTVVASLVERPNTAWKGNS